MGSKIHFTTLGLILALLTTAQAYNVSKTYPLNESGGAIVDEIIIDGRNNQLLTQTLPGLIVVLATVFLIFCSITVGILVLIFFFKKMTGGK